PERCEICHKADLFDPKRNWCGRCSEAHLNRFQQEKLYRQAHQTVLGRCLCRLGLPKWHYIRWGPYCAPCGPAQPLWSFIKKTIEWKQVPALEAEGPGISQVILPLRQWRCMHCFGMVLSVHPPGYFEACPYCGKTDYVGRKRSWLNNGS